MTLYIRDFPEELWKTLKIKAAEEGTSLKDLCIELLKESADKKK